MPLFSKSEWFKDENDQYKLKSDARNRVALEQAWEGAKIGAIFPGSLLGLTSIAITSLLYSKDHDSFDFDSFKNPYLIIMVATTIGLLLLSMAFSAYQQKQY